MILMRKSVSALLLAAVLFVPATSMCAYAGQVKNVIVMIPDGMSMGGYTLTRWYRGGGAMAMDALACGLVRTYSSDAAIADSAPAATAMATGFKSHTGYIGILPDEATMPGQKPVAESDKRRPVATVLEAARLKGKATGLVVTCEVMHATPAGFASHDPSRKNYDNLSEQEVYNGIDVVLGGGYKFFTHEGRRDGEDLISEMKKLGYAVITTPDELKQVKAKKVYGLFAPEALSYDMDRDPAKEPSLAEMTKKSIEILSRNKNGFFLMVEGSEVDWAAHANDPVGLISEISAFDDAVKAALDFAKKDRHTAILIMADHGNGGVTMGDAETTKNYDKTVLDDYFKVIRKAKYTGEGLEKLLKPDMDDEAIRNTVAAGYGITDLSNEEVAAVRDGLAVKKGELNYVVGPMMSRRSHIGWTTGGHTGEDVELFAYAPAGERPTGTIDNTDVAVITAKYLGLDLDKTTRRLYVDADKAFEAKGAEIGIDATSPANPVLVVKKGSAEIRIPANKNYALVNGKTVTLDGVAVFNGSKWYVSRKAVDLVK
ncbi:MAG TPA: alkaline phosphatase [Desulfomonilia bacterium]|nr:alkaline phosphatase [Desulfomonilia bacterium]